MIGIREKENWLEGNYLNTLHLLCIAVSYITVNNFLVILLKSVKVFLL